MKQFDVDKVKGFLKENKWQKAMFYVINTYDCSQSEAMETVDAIVKSEKADAVLATVDPSWGDDKEDQERFDGQG
jgi:hypothetical protein